VGRELIEGKDEIAVSVDALFGMELLCLRLDDSLHVKKVLAGYRIGGCSLSTRFDSR
jgi:hypothetical protein